MQSTVEDCFGWPIIHLWWKGIPFLQRKSGGKYFIKNAMPDNVGLSGFFAGGEIGPEALAMQNVNNDFRNKAAIQGFTAVYGVFFVPRILRQVARFWRWRWKRVTYHFSKLDHRYPLQCDRGIFAKVIFFYKILIF